MSNITNTSGMEVIKRNGEREKVSLNKITERIKSICTKFKITSIDEVEVAIETITGLTNGITTEELDIYAANKCAEKVSRNYDYAILAAGISVSNLHKSTPEDFIEVTNRLYYNKDKQGANCPLITNEYRSFVKKNIETIRNAIDYERDYYFDFFAIKTLERSYLIRLSDKKPINCNNNSSNKEIDIRKEIGWLVERPQHMFMRVSLAIHLDDINAAIETYDMMSNRFMVHASPTLYNAGTIHPQLSSCFLLNMDDSIEGIFETITDAAMISKRAGGIGINMSNIRSKGSKIRGTNGNSDGLVRLIKLLNEEARYVNQGGRRKGAFALYIEPWHADVYDFCELRKVQGAEELRARDIFLALWVNDLFMKRVQSNGDWCLMCPDECLGLTETYGEEFEALYIKYENEGRYKKKVKAYHLMMHILGCQTETGMPYMMFKDNVNNKSNQKNVGTIQCSNLCSEIVEYTSKDEIAVCNLASICLPRFVESDKDNKDKLSINYTKIYQTAKVLTKNLNKIIDINFYPVDKAKVSNMRHRPIGVGVQGLSDVFMMMDLPYDSDEARDINTRIFETIYFGCLESSMELAKLNGPYETFQGSPFSEGKLQWHLWGLKKEDLLMDWDWDKLISDIIKYGTRNSLLTTVMPTATTSQIMGCTEACEPRTTNLYTRSTLAGEYIVVNPFLINKLSKLGLWTDEIREEFIYDNGSIQNIDEIPDEIKAIFETAFEMKSKPIVRQAIGRGPFIDQSQSQNLFSNKPDFNKLYQTHLYSWSNGLKTGMYYLRSQAAVDPIEFGLDQESINRILKKRGIEIDNVIIDDKNAEATSNEATDKTHDKEKPKMNPNVRSMFADCDSCS